MNQNYAVVWVMRTDSFRSADKAAWLAQVMNDLKTNDITVYDRLRWTTPEGITTEPYYTADELTTAPVNDMQSAQHQVGTTGSTAGNGWLNTPNYQVSDPKADNPRLRQALTAGADALLLELAPEMQNAGQVSHLLNGIKLSESPIFFRVGDPARFITVLQQVAPYQLKGGLLTDPVATCLQTGVAPALALKSIADATRQSMNSPAFRTVCASSHVFHNAGATVTQELAFLLANLADQFDALTDMGLSVDQLARKTMLSVSVGTSYFTEIAKLRALRVLWQRFISAYSFARSPLPTAFLHCQTSTFYEAAATPYTNLLRTTTEAMSAVMGGCDALTVYPHDRLTSPAVQDQEFSQRIARNVSVLLREESYLDKVADPSAGSYYLETLTHQLTEAAWSLFLQVEQQGGGGWLPRRPGL